ncbi:MAG: heavy metal translocating P-type ATPase, partial [Treponema sp.]|nr:heavy metal translocating P-type ATPase [Treponema sp.]
GKTLESHSKGKTTSAIKSLLELSPETACVIRDGKEITINASEVLHGDIFIVKPGQKIPVDGIVLEGISAVNESALTGESIPVDKSKGSEVYSATINQNGALTCKATKVGEETSLNQIIKLVEEASSSKAPVAKLADKVSGVFVPVVIVIALVTGSVWLAIGKTFGFALARAVSVLVISCPCALGLATPVAIMVGSGLGAKNGILFKNATALEECGKTDIVVLDKTGTVTEGNPIVTDVVLQDDITEDELLATAASLEAKSEHPLSKAIMNYILQKNISVVEAHSFEALPGFGVKATVDGKTLLGGNAELLKKIISPELLHKGNTLSEEGKTPLYFACDEKSLGIIAVADVAKKDSKKAIEQMQNENIQVVMLTGDNEKTANAIAKTVSIKNVIANVLPDDKDKVVSKLQQQGKVTMVGDGINDAPALTRAEIGIAIGAGTDVALEAADVVLMKSSLMDVVGAIHLSKAVLKNIKQNLFWAFCYNVIGIPVAAGVLFPAFGIVLNPMIGSLAMSLSSFCVVTNALRLNLFNPYKKIHSAKNNLPLELIQNNQDTNNESTMEALMTKTISIEGMMCNNCKMHVENALLKVQGVSAVNASVENKNATVTLAEDVANDVLANAVTEAGYTVNGVQ